MGKKLKDWSNVKVGRLQPLYIDETKPRGKYKNIYWICKCDCGELISVNTSNLQSGLKQKREMHCNKCTLYEDLTNKIFGNLKVIKKDDTKLVRPVWVCECLSCGNIVSVYACNLKRGHSVSCGCIDYSIGEENINKILNDNNITFKREYSFRNLYRKKKLRFDFALIDNEGNVIRLIEYDGKHHSLDYNLFGGEKTLTEIKEKDNLKNEFSLHNNIPLVRIPYTERDSITLNKLLYDINYEVRDLNE